MSLNPVLANRRSVRAFLERSIDPSDLEALFEAARWAPSNGNRQPWRFILRTARERREAMGPCLSRGNAWAVRAPALVTVACRLSDGGYSNGIHYAIYDCALAVMCLTIEAESRGLRVHQMAGWQKEPLSRELDLPEGVDPVVVLAIGYEGSLESLDQALQEKEKRPRERKASADVWTHDVWSEEWPRTSGAPAGGR